MQLISQPIKGGLFMTYWIPLVIAGLGACSESRTSGKRTFSERYLSVTSNFATLKPLHSGNATKRSRGCIISRSFVAINIPLIVIAFFEIIISLGVGWLALLILEVGAMRRPEVWDRRGGTNSHVFFVLQIIIINAEFGSS